MRDAVDDIIDLVGEEVVEGGKGSLKKSASGEEKVAERPATS